MSKIVQAVNAMISNPKNITNVIPNDSLYYFLYNQKYKWSICKSIDNDYYLCYYPGKIDINDLAEMEDYHLEDVPMIAYRASEIGTKEAKASFSELYTAIKENVYDVNIVLDDIISDLDL